MAQFTTLNLMSSTKLLNRSKIKNTMKKKIHKTNYLKMKLM